METTNTKLEPSIIGSYPGIKSLRVSLIHLNDLSSSSHTSKNFHVLNSLFHFISKQDIKPVMKTQDNFIKSIEFLNYRNYLKKQ